MKHYTGEEWANFARDVVEQKAKLMMQKHLDTGCGECAHELSLWRRVSETAKRSTSSVEPSAGAVRIAKALFVTHGPARVSSKRLMAKLLFDSRNVAVAVGVRSSAPSPRQLLFGVGDHRIDLRLEPQLDSDKVAVIGQLLDSSNPEQQLRNVPISLLQGKKLVDSSETNHFGEFQLECELTGRLELRAMLPQGHEISVALIEPASPVAPYPIDSIEQRSLLREEKKSTRTKL